MADAFDPLLNDTVDHHRNLVGAEIRQCPATFFEIQSAHISVTRMVGFRPTGRDSVVLTEFCRKWPDFCHLHWNSVNLDFDETVRIPAFIPKFGNSS
jgi:hypothetical protein